MLWQGYSGCLKITLSQEWKWGGKRVDLIFPQDKMEIISVKEKIRKLGERIQIENTDACSQELKDIIEAETGELEKAEVS